MQPPSPFQEYQEHQARAPSRAIVDSRMLLSSPSVWKAIAPHPEGTGRIPER